MRQPPIRAHMVRFGPSSLALIAGNCIPVVLALLFGWDVFNVMILFWLENLIVGALNLVRMATCKPADPASWAMRLFFMPFFAVHYGMFCLVHGVFVVVLFGAMASHNDPFSWDPVAQVLDAGLWLGAICLFASHVVSLLVNWFGRGEYNETSIQSLMVRPYGRIVVLHVAIIFGGMPVMMTGSHWIAVALLMLFKTALDLGAHWHERHVLEEGTTRE